jgi:hypothetical protein
MTKQCTILFDYDIHKFSGSPFKAETPFGSPVMVGKGNVFDERDALEASHAVLLEALEAAEVELQWCLQRGVSNDVLRQIDAAIAAAKEPTNG